MFLPSITDLLIQYGTASFYCHANGKKNLVVTGRHWPNSCGTFNNYNQTEMTKNDAKQILNIDTYFIQC